MVGPARATNRSPAGGAVPPSLTPGSPRAPLAIQEIIDLEPPPSYNSTCRHDYDLPRLRCPKYSKVANTLVLALVTYLVYYEIYFGSTILKQYPTTDCIIQGGEGCQSLDITSLYGEKKLARIGTFCRAIYK